MRTVVWEQRLDGTPVFEGLAKGHITRRGELVNIASRFLPDAEAACGMDRDERERFPTRFEPGPSFVWERLRCQSLLLVQLDA